MILALSLMLSNLPMVSSYAAEYSENSIDDIETAVTEEEAQTEASSEAGDFYFNVSADGKALGSDGIVYENVAYLSADVVAALDTDVQDHYIEICDSVAEWSQEGIEDIVIAANDEGELFWSYYVPGTILADAENAFVEELIETAQSNTKSTEIEGAETESTEIKSAQTESTETENIETKTAEVKKDTESTETEIAEEKEDTKTKTTETESTEIIETKPTQSEILEENTETKLTQLEGTETENAETKPAETESTETENTETKTAGEKEDTETTETKPAETESTETENTETKTAGEKKDTETTETETAEETENTETKPAETESTETENTETAEDIEKPTQSEGTETENTETETAEETEDIEKSTQSETLEEGIETNSTELESTETESTETETQELLAAQEQDSPVLQAENMELLAEIKEEQIELVEPISVNTIDLGYGTTGEFYSTLPSTSYFSSQLNGAEKNIYNIACSRLTEGKNTFSFSGDAFNDMKEALMRALSAIVLTYPDKTDWMAKSYIPSKSGFAVLFSNSGNSHFSANVEVMKSQYYNSALEASTNTKVAQIAEAAQTYALQNYAASPAYGVVVYFDKWLCESNYYSYEGGVYGNLGEDVYYYCHSAYGSLLKGYAVCESYAKAMSRLLDAVGIPNMYVTGYSGSPNAGHAWNYVQMPDGKWYLLDTTWNNPSTSAADAYRTSNQQWLLVPDDGQHTPVGKEYLNQANGFKFAALSNSKYKASKTELAFDQGSLLDMYVKSTQTLTIEHSNIKSNIKEWTSSNTSVAKVSSNGKVTAVAPGTAKITLTIYEAGVAVPTSCVVNVYQMKSLTSSRTGKTSDALSIGTDTTGTITLDVNVGNSPYTAEELVAKKLKINNKTTYSDPTVSYSKQGIVTAQASLTNNQIKVAVTSAASSGSATVKVKFGGKTASIKVTVGKMISEDMFSIDLASAKIENGSIEYTGKAIKPKVTKKAEITENVTFSVAYLNNKNVGKATIKISGKGKYGGEILKTFAITPVDISTASISKIKNKVYNGGSNPAKITVKLGKKTLSAKNDYVIKYNGNTSDELGAGSYVVTIEGKGNYTGTVSQTETYTIQKNKITKVTASCASKVKFTGGKIFPVIVKIGKNILPSSDYEITYYRGKKTGSQYRTDKVEAPTTKGAYFAVITIKGSNLENTAKKTEIIKKFTVK